MNRLPITKTPKVYVGGAFIRSESGRTFAIKDAGGRFFANVPQCTRKDLRNAVEAAAKAGPGWAKRTPYNRGQILYRLGEMLEARKADMADALLLGGGSKSAAAKEIAAAVDRLIYYAGWADKYEQVLGSVNPVAAPYFNFTVTEPMGIVGVIAPDEAPLLGLVSLVAPDAHVARGEVLLKLLVVVAVPIGAGLYLKAHHPAFAMRRMASSSGMQVSVTRFMCRARRASSSWGVRSR